jgi:hypothetical protein
MTRAELWRHYDAAKTGGDLELAIRYLALLLIRTIERIPKQSAADQALAELLRREAAGSKR